MRIIIALVSILILGFIIRIWNLSEIPSGFFADEAGQALSAYKILHTGKGIDGNTFPFYFNIFGPIGPVAIYDQVLTISIFGLNEFSARFTAVTIGTLTILVIYFTTKLLTNSSKIGIFASLLTATAPWHIHFSRIAFENIRVPFYVSLFLLCFVYGIKNDKKLLIIIALLFLFLGFYSYTAADVFIPPFLFCSLIIYRKYFLHHLRFFAIFISLTLIFSIPFINHLREYKNENRFSRVSVFKDSPLSKALTQMAKTYVQSYSLDFLFVKGDSNMPGHFVNRHSVKGFGELYLFTAPFFLFGILLILFTIKKKGNQIILLWLILYPLGSVVSGIDGGGPFATRSIIGVSVFQIITAYGIVNIMNLGTKIHMKRLFVFLLLLLLIISTYQYLKAYLTEYPKYSSDFWGWQYGPKEIMKYFLTVNDKYDELYMSGEFNGAHIFLSFYDPENTCRSKCKMGDFFREPQIYNPSKRQLFSVSPDYLSKSNFVKDFLVKKTIYYPNGTIAFQIGEIVK